MRSSSRFLAPSAAAVLSTVMLCAPAASQIPTGPASSLPSVTVDAPKQVARPHRVAPVVSTVSRRTSSTVRTTAQTSPATTEAIMAGPGTAKDKLGRLEKISSNCNGGCESSLPHGKDPWVGCSGAWGDTTTMPFSTTCRDNLTYRSFASCAETKIFLGENRNKAWWVCSSLLAGGKFKVAELKRSRR
jgi:hypothetical protein